MNGLRFLLVKAIPYTLTFFAGAGVFFLSIYKPTAWSDWLVEISGALSAIPIVFLIYEYSNYKLTNGVNKSLYNNLTFEVNSVVLRILRFFHGALGTRERISWTVIEKMLLKTATGMKKELKINRKDIQVLKSYKEEFDNLLYKTASANVFDSGQFEAIAAIPRELSHLINELEFRGNRDEITHVAENLFTLINNWFDLCEEEALKSHSHFRLMETQAAGK